MERKRERVNVAKMSTISEPGRWLYLYLDIHMIPSIHLHLEREMFIIFSLQLFCRFDFFFFLMRSWGGGKGSTHLCLLYEACPDRLECCLCRAPQGPLDTSMSAYIH